MLKIKNQLHWDKLESNMVNLTELPKEFPIIGVILELFYLLSSSSVCSASKAYTSLARDLKYLLKVLYIILIYYNQAKFSIFNTLCLGSLKTLTYV